MNKEEFRKLAELSLEEVIQFAEIFHGGPLPRNIVFQWGYGEEKEKLEGDIAQIIADNPKVYQDDEHINPFVDLIPYSVLPNNKLLIVCYVSGFKPQKFGKNWQGRMGPFCYMVNSRLTNPDIDKEEILKKLREKGLTNS
jgi:hypothetical protein